MIIKTVNDLLIYQMALELSIEVAVLLKKIPYYWNIPEVKQVVRSSGSAASNIREDFGQRFYPKQLLRYLNIALGSSDESQGHLEKLKKEGYLEQEIADEYCKKYKNLSIKTLNFINYIKKMNGIILR